MTIAAVNGVELYYEEHGSGQPLLLIHGTGAYADQWAPVLEGLATTYRVISYDRRGFARSATAARGGLADQTRDAAALLDALDASPAVVVGWSGGGVIALDLAASYPAQVKELVLAEPAVSMLLHPTRSSVAMSARFTAHRARRNQRAAAQTMYRWAGGYTTGGNAYDGYSAEWQEQMCAHAATTTREMDQLLRPYPSRKAIRSITCPVTMIDGDLSDPAFVKAAASVRRLLPQARSVLLTGAAHMLHIDQPQQWVDAVVSLQAPEAQALRWPA